MKEYLLSFWNKFIKGTIKFKTFIILLIILYIGVIGVCLVKVEVDSTIPGGINNVSNLIDIESEYEPGDISTVSIYSENKMSYLQYLLVKLDSNSDISLGQSISQSVYTEKEEYASNVGYKKQSIQDALIVAYTFAKNNGHDVYLDHSYKGEYLINIPQNLYKTGSDDFKNGDIIISFNNSNYSSTEDYINSLHKVFDGVMFNEKTISSMYKNGELNFRNDDSNNTLTLISDIYSYLNTINNEYSFTILRGESELTITPSYKMLFFLYTNVIKKTTNGKKEMFSVTSNRFAYYNIDHTKSSPKINLSTANTVGPSGGLMQTLAVYNSITKDDITKGLRVMGTGGIDLNGNATQIGGEQQKIVVANLYSANVFFVPNSNYKSAKEKYDSLSKPSFDLVSVENFNDVIDYFNKLEVPNE